MQILRFRFPLFKRGLTMPQRLCYMSSTLFWLFPFPRTIFLFAPLFYLFFDLEIFTASGGEFLAYTLIYMLVNLMMQNYLYGRFRWPWISELYEYDAVRLPAAGVDLGDAQSAQADLQGDGQGRDRRSGEPHLGARRPVLRHLRRAARRQSP